MNSPATIKATFPIIGMSCAACASRIDKTINALKGVHTAQVNYAAASLYVEYDSSCSPEQLKFALQELGYDLIIIQDLSRRTEMAEEADTQRLQRLKRNTFLAASLSIPTAIISMFFINLPYAEYIVWILSTPVVFWLGRSFHISTWKQLRKRQATMDTLVSSSTSIAYLFSLFNLFFPQFWIQRGITPHLYFEASCVIITFILLGRFLEERAKKSTSSAIRKLMNLQPQQVLILNGQQQAVEVRIDEVNVEDIVIARPGERIAVDGIVTEGLSYVDESMITGEPLAVKKEAGMTVYAGTINQKGSFRFKAQKVGHNTLLAQIIHRVQEAQGSKAPVQKMADRIASVFVPAIIIIALSVFMLWWLMASENGFSYGILTMVTVLIIACPCALGLATPTAIMAGIGKGAENGILIKDAESLETARKIDTIVLDKTGTITQGKPTVSEIIWDENFIPCPELLYSIEKLSEHPLATAICQKFVSESMVTVSRFESITGQGVKAIIEAQSYFIGNRQLMEKQHITLSNELATSAERMAKNGQSIVWFADAQKARAVIGISDPIKETSVQAVHAFKKMGVDVFMLTGDQEEVAQHIAAQCGITHYCANASPEGKADFIQHLIHDGRHVAMIGDGINDSAALASSHLSIAMGKGSDIAMDVAQMTIISSDLMLVPDAFRLSEATVRTIRQNLFWAFLYNTISIPIAAGILFPLNGFLLNPMIAGAAMAMSSVSVVSNSLRLKRFSLHKTNINDSIIKDSPIAITKKYTIGGMMCQHCRLRVEELLNNIEGVQAHVSLDPPIATLTFEEGIRPIDVLQKALQKDDYSISPLESNV